MKAVIAFTKFRNFTGTSIDKGDIKTLFKKL